MNPYLSVILLGFVSILEIGLQPHLSYMGATPDLMLLSVTLWSLVQGPLEGVFWALVGGFFLSIFSGGPVGVLAFGMIPAALIAGMGQTRFFGGWSHLPMVATFIAYLAYGLTIFLILHLIGWGGDFVPSIRYQILPNAIYTTLLSPFLYPAFRWLHYQTVGERLEFPG